MKKIFSTFFSIALVTISFGQTITGHSDFPSTITWPFLWDLEEDDQGNLYTCSERGELFKKSNGTWETFDLDLPVADDDIRKIAIDDDGVIWAGTESGLVAIDNGTITLTNSTNSSLPVDYIRLLVADGNKLWMYPQSNGLVLKEGNTFTQYLSTNSDLPNDFITDLKVDDEGTVYVAASRDLTIIKGNQWTNYDFGTMFGFGVRINEMFIDHNQSVWFGTDEGVIKYNKFSNNFEDLRNTYGQNNYSAIHYTTAGELWLCELFEGIHYFKLSEPGYFFDGDSTDAPTQVFEFLYYQDTMRVIGNIGATVTGLTIGFADIDEDGYGSNLDCDDTNPDVNPGETEVPYNGLDDDCDPLTLDDDLDEDGFNIAEDCDDMNPAINPDATEIPDNDIDENCDGNDLSDVQDLTIDQIELYPNPVGTGILFIKNAHQLDLQISIYDHLGKRLLSTSKMEMDVSALNSGAYFIEIEDLDNEVKVFKKLLIL